MTKLSILIVTDEEKQKIMENVNYASEDKLNEDIDLVLEWFKKQQHLPRIQFDRRQVRNILISRKGSVEQTKQKIDLMYSLRNIIPEISAPRDIRNPRMANVSKGCCYYIMPKLNHDLTRISFISFKDTDPSFFNHNDFVNYVFTTIEYRLLYDSFAGDRYLIDMRGFNIAHMTKITLMLIKHTETFIRKAYGIRVFGMHVVNASPLLNKLLVLIKSGLSDKLRSRLHVHPTLEDLYKTIDREILPVDFGGQESSQSEIIELWNQELNRDEVRNHLIAQEVLKSDETLRIGNKLDEEILGMAGSFRKLDVD